MIEVKWLDGVYGFKGERYKFEGSATLYEPNYEYWLKHDTWNEAQAILLLHDIDPFNLAIARFSDTHQGIGFIRGLIEEPSTLRKTMLEAWSFLWNAINSETIPFKKHLGGWLFDKKIFVQWAHSKGFEIPKPLKVLLDTKLAQEKITPRSKSKKKRMTKDESALDAEVNDLYRIYKKSGWKKGSLYQAYDERKFDPVIIKEWMLKNTQSNPIPEKYLKRNFQNRFKKLVSAEKKKNPQKTK